MAEYILSHAAAADLDTIYLYSFGQFGETQAESYLLSLEETLQMLCRYPQSGKDMGHIRKGYRCHAHLSHTVYYLQRPKHIFIVRILHSRMQSESHL